VRSLAFICIEKALAEATKAVKRAATFMLVIVVVWWKSSGMNNELSVGKEQWSDADEDESLRLILSLDG